MLNKNYINQTKKLYDSCYILVKLFKYLNKFVFVYTNFSFWCILYFCRPNSNHFSLEILVTCSTFELIASTRFAIIQMTKHICQMQ